MVPEFVHQVLSFEEPEETEGENYTPSDIFTINDNRFKYSISDGKVCINVAYDRLLKPSLPQAVNHLALADFFKEIKSSLVYPELTLSDTKIEDFLLKDAINLQENTQFYVKKCSLESNEAKTILNRFQCFSVWFIETASLVDYNSKNFTIYFLYSTKDNITLVGFVLVYKFSNFLKGPILRICQQVLSPQYQNKGLGRSLLSFVYKGLLTENPYEVNVEDPNENFEILRNRVEYEIIIKSKVFKETIETVIETWAKQDAKEWFEVSKLFVLNKEKLEKIHKEAPIDKKQIQKLFELCILGRLEIAMKKYPNEITKLYDIFNLALKLRIKAEYFGCASDELVEETDEKVKEQMKLMEKEAINKLFSTIKVQYSNLLCRINIY